MSKPFIIWTMRRTGGTSLTDMLMEISEYNTMDHEPFLLERELGYVTKEFMSLHKDNRAKEIKQTLENLFNKKVLIKHCYEILGSDFNKALVDNLALRSDYKHIFLLRKNEVSRMLSLMLAFQTDVWGKHGSESIYRMIHSGEKSLLPFDLNIVAKEEKIAIESTRYIKYILDEKDIDVLPIFFEDLYTGEKENRIKKLEELFSFLEFDKDQILQHKELIEHTLFNRSQKSHSVLNFVPNLEEVKTFIFTIPGIDSITQFKKSSIKTKKEIYMLDQLLSEKSTEEKKEISLITLYVGAHKTATTHFQGILHANSQRLLENNIKLTMPGNVRKEWLPALFHYCNHSDDDSKQKVYSFAPEKGRWLLTEENIVGVSNDFTELSGIYPRSKTRLACIQEICSGTPMELFFSLRSYETFYRSAYSEVIRNRGYIPFDQFYDEERFKNNSWIDTIRGFTEVIPQERITLWRYEDFRDLVPELLERMTGIQETDEMINAYKAERTRPSLSQKTIDILDSLYPVLDRKESLKLVERINNEYPVGQYKSLNPFSEEDNERLKKQYEKDIEIIKKDFPSINFLGVKK